MRILATAALAFSAAVFLAYYVIPAEWLPIAAARAALLGAGLALTRRKWLRPAALALVFFALGLLRFSLFTQRTIETAREYNGQICEASAVLLDYPDVYPEYCRLHVRITDGELPAFKAIVYDNDKQMRDARPGDRIKNMRRSSAASRNSDTVSRSS